MNAEEQELDEVVLALRRELLLFVIEEIGKAAGNHVTPLTEQIAARAAGQIAQQVEGGLVSAQARQVDAAAKTLSEAVIGRLDAEIAASDALNAIREATSTLDAAAAGLSAARRAQVPQPDDVDQLQRIERAISLLTTKLTREAAVAPPEECVPFQTGRETPPAPQVDAAPANPTPVAMAVRAGSAPVKWPWSWWKLRHAVDSATEHAPPGAPADQAEHDKAQQLVHGKTAVTAVRRSLSLVLTVVLVVSLAAVVFASGSLFGQRLWRSVDATRSAAQAMHLRPTPPPLTAAVAPSQHGDLKSQLSALKDKAQLLESQLLQTQVAKRPNDKSLDKTQTANALTAVTALKDALTHLNRKPAAVVPGKLAKPAPGKTK